MDLIKTLKRTVESLDDADTRRVVEEAVAVHSLLLTHRHTIKGKKATVWNEATWLRHGAPPFPHSPFR